MDIRQYISSGIIESYVLGLASEEEARELQDLSLQYPEINASINEYEETLEEYAILHAVKPPQELKSRIWSQLKEEVPAEETSVQQEQVRHISSAPGWIRVALAAAIILLIVSAGLNIIFFNKYQTASHKYNDLALAQQTLVAQNQTFQTRLEQTQRDVHIMTDTSMKSIIMSGVKGHPGMMATVYWNASSNALYLTVNNLPQPSAGKQYQLWAIVDGKPVSAGVFNMQNVKEALQKMQPVNSKAQAFAITLEPEGGSLAPHLDQMYVMGKNS